MHKLLPGLLWSLFIIGMMVLLSFVDKAHEELICEEVNIHIDQNDENYFVEEKDIEALLPFDLSKNQLIPISKIDVSNIERQLSNHPAIKNAEVYMTLGGKLSVYVNQRKPIARIFTQEKESYYIDEEGFLMPLSEKYAARVMVISGHLDAPYVKWYQTGLNQLMQNDSLKNKTLLDELFNLSRFIHRHPFWKAQIEQLYVNKDLEVELIPRVGSHTIVLGEITDIEEKFQKLMIFYKEGLTKTGWNEYSVINLKFENQVVCIKRYN